MVECLKYPSIILILYIDLYSRPSKKQHGNNKTPPFYLLEVSIYVNINTNMEIHIIPLAVQGVGRTP